MINKEQIKNYIKSNPTLFAYSKEFLKFNEFVYYALYKNSIFYFNQLFQELGLSKRYEKLKSLKNSKNGRCFIVATGPSLTKEDLQKLKNETTFGVNALVKWFPEVGWETTYFGIQDLRVYKNLKKEIDSIISSKVFFSLDGTANYKDNKLIDLKQKTNTCEFPLYLGLHPIQPYKLYTKFSNNASKIVFDGYSVVYSLIQIAIYMGFKEIYLLGTDCNYKNQKNYAIENYDYKRDIYKIQGDRMIFAYDFAKEYADKHGIKIYNATRGGMLEVFPRVDLDEVLKNKENSK